MGFSPIEHASLTDVGVRRSHNQDSCAVLLANDRAHWLEYGHVFVVADGMGGHAVGEKASAQAARDIPLIYQKHGRVDAPAALRRAFAETNAAIHEVGVQNPEFKGMGTTATALILRADGAWVGHVGDSRAYRVRGGLIDQLTFDHSYLWYEARRQGVDPKEIKNVRSNVILRSIGPEAQVEADVEGPYPLEPGDTFVLCSDGLSGPVSDREIGMVASTLPPKEASQFLIDLANLRGGPDNISVIVVRIGASDSDSASLPARPRGPGLMTSLGNFASELLQLVPWPILVLAFGFLLAVVAFLLMLNALAGPGVFVALVAAGVIVGGLVGLNWHAQQEPPPPVVRPPDPRPSIYQQTSCEVVPGVLEELVRADAHLRQRLKESSWDADWTSYQKHRDAADTFERAQDLVGAFRERCRAMAVLAKTFNRHRQREEVFSPKWDVAAR
jgi:protein phosphatase